MSIELLKIPQPLRYGAALELQRARGAALEASTDKLATLILLQHTPVFTLGRKTGANHLLPDSGDMTRFLPTAVGIWKSGSCPQNPAAEELAARTGAEVVETDRGGSVTFHAPGQLTAYLLLNLHAWELTIHAHLDKLEQVAIQTLARFGIAGRREPRMTGVWVDSGDMTRFQGHDPISPDCGRDLEIGIVSPESSGSPPVRKSGSCPRNPPAAEKICAIGVSVRRWVTYHGLSLNVDLDLAPFLEVVPCGLAGKAVTSMSRVLGRPVPLPAVEDAMTAAFSEVYGAPLLHHRDTETQRKEVER